MTKFFCVLLAFVGLATTANAQLAFPVNPKVDETPVLTEAQIASRKMVAAALLTKKEINFITGRYARYVLRLQEKTYRNWSAGSVCYKKDQQVLSIKVNDYGNIEVVIDERKDIPGCNNAIKLVINPENLEISLYEGPLNNMGGPWGKRITSVD